ncbi:MAG: DUF3618 domain-containing protein, partial [Geminicoccaceae bacterium]|nr:DUF3618 domain-containing protein [Geminicoccaceae bacterium]
MSEDSRSPDQIQRDIERRRAAMSDTIDQLQDRFSPGQMMDQTLEYFRTSGTGQGMGEFGRNLSRTIRDNPVPLTLLGLGLGWLLLGGGPSSGRIRRRGQSIYDRYYSDDELDELDELELYDPDEAAAYAYDPGLRTTDDVLSRGTGPGAGTIYGPTGEPARTVPVDRSDEGTGDRLGSATAAARARAGGLASSASESVSSAGAAGRSAAGSARDSASAASQRTGDAARRAGAGIGSGASAASGAARDMGGAMSDRARSAAERARQAAGEARQRASQAASDVYGSAAEAGGSARGRYARARMRAGAASADARRRMRAGMTRAQLRAEQMRARAASGMSDAAYRARYGANRARD